MSEPTGTSTPSTPAAPAPRPPSRVQVTWAGDHVFDGQLAAGGPSIRMDGSGQLGPNMVAVVLIALAGCTGVDIVDILAKRRTPIEAMTVDVEGARYAGVPGRLTEVTLVYRITGAGIDRAQAERAIELSVTKYCSVRESLDPNMPVTWRLELNGEG
jgi:putative redox protein